MNDIIPVIILVCGGLVWFGSCILAAKVLSGEFDN